MKLISDSHGNSVSAKFLGMIHCLINQFVGYFTRLIHFIRLRVLCDIDHHDADTGCDGVLGKMELLFVLNFLPEARLAQLCSCVESDKDEKFISTGSTDNVRIAMEDLAQNFRHHQQNVITFLMPVSIIDRLELVEIQGESYTANETVKHCRAYSAG
jgi:hypothetical protein